MRGIRDDWANELAGAGLLPIDIPNYRILEKVGVGAESSIYRARCMRSGKDYAVKYVKVTKPEDTSYVDLLKTEHAIGTAVDHPVIRGVYELRLLRQRLRLRGAILFMEFVEGMPMSDKEFQKPLVELLGLFSQVALGLHAMHYSGYVHADLKPNNILVTPDEQVKLIDFGQSSKMREAKPRVQGTIDYIAPEQVSRGVLDERTDVFGLGAALHRVLTGKPVATGMNQTVSVYSQGLVGKRVSQVREPTMSALPPTLVRLIDDCCKTDPADRISDMSALMERIKLAQAILTKQAAGSGAPIAIGKTEEGESSQGDDQVSPDDSAVSFELPDEDAPE